jgi:hypothetical protein
MRAATEKTNAVAGGLHPDLARLLEFYREARAHPPEALLHRAGVIPEPGFFTVASLQRHLNNPLLHPKMIDLVHQGRKIPLDQACFYKVVQTKQLFFMDKRFIEEYLQRGASILLEGLDLLDPEINAFAAALDAGLPCALVNAVAFFSQRANELYRGHIDTDDVLVIQLSGEKKWRLYAKQAPRRVNLNELTPEQMGTQIAEITMRPGDAMYVRCGVPHICETPASHSLHISFDLCDRVPNAQQICEMGLARYQEACRDPYTPADEVAKTFASLLQSEAFQAELNRRADGMLGEARVFREHIGGASRIDYLSRFNSR